MRFRVKSAGALSLADVSECAFRLQFCEYLYLSLSWAPRGGPTTRWSTTLPSNVILPHATNLGAFSGANLVTLRLKRNPRTPLCG